MDNDTRRSCPVVMRHLNEQQAISAIITAPLTKLASSCWQQQRSCSDDGECCAETGTAGGGMDSRR